MHQSCLLAILFVFVTMSGSRAQSKWDRVRSEMQNQQFQTALTLLVELDSTMERTSKMAYCQYRLGRWSKAKANYLEILRQDSTRQDAHLHLGSMYDREFNLPKAIKHYVHLTELDSTNPTYFKLTGKVYSRAHLKRLALDYYQQALALNPQDISLYLDMSAILMDNRQFEEADTLITRAKALDTTNLAVLLAEARCQYGFKDYPGVVQALEKTRPALDLTPFYLKMLGYAYLQIDSLDLAIHTLTNLLYKEESEYTYSYLGKAHYAKGNWPEATRFYEKAIEQGTSDHLDRYHTALTKLYDQAGDLSAAIKHCEEAYRHSGNPVHIFTKAQKCELYYRDKNMALSQYRRFLKLTKAKGQHVDYANQRIKALKEYLHQAAK